MDLLLALQNWFSEHCDGEWEQDCGVNIESLDNPGWMVTISLTDTELESRPFRTINEVPDPDGPDESTGWLHCYTTGDVWHGAGDETKLPVILQAFLSWASSDPDLDEDEFDDDPPA
jgi:Immunity protein 53